ncbi:MAG: carbohydrate-binding protein [Prevotellaceae bacterium]|nr:carbohydrate-binding protein [Prevotellaceae bacterium]
MKNIPNTFLAENYTTGGEGITYHDSDYINEGEIYRHDGVDIEPCSDGNANIFNIMAGEWLDYQLNVPNTANYKFEFRMSSPQGAGKFHVEVDGVDKTGSISVPTTGSYQTWTTFSVSNISLTQGTRTFRFVMEENGFNFAGFVISFEQPDIPVGKQIIIKNGVNYVTFDAQNQVICNSPTITPNCVFTVEQNGNFIELRAANGQYISTTSLTNPMTLNASNRFAITKFLWHNLQNNSKMFGLKSFRTNAVVCSENGTKPMNCNRYDFGGWEKFTWEEYVSSGVEEVKTNNDLKIYFNSETNEINLSDFENRLGLKIEIYDISGRTVWSLSCEGLRKSFNVSALPSGIYLVKAGAKTAKFIKR